MKRILFIAEKNKKPEMFVEEAMIIPRIKGLPQRLWTDKFYRNFRKIFVFQKILQLRDSVQQLPETLEASAVSLLVR